MTLKETQTFFYHLCKDENFDFSKERLEDIVCSQTAKHLLKLSPLRQKIYRTLIQNNVTALLESTFENTLRFLSTEEKTKLIRQFLSQNKISSNHYRHISYEFYDFFQNLSEFTQYNLDFLKELATYEFQHYNLIFHEYKYKEWPQFPDLQLNEAKFIFNPALYFYTFQYPVHKSHDFLESPTVIKKEKSHLLIYRNPVDFKIQDFTLSETSFMFLKTFYHQPSLTLSEGLEKIFSQTEKNLSEDFIQDILGFLKILLEKKIILALVPKDYV